MKVLLIGATGPTGRQVLARAAARGIALRSLARNPEALADVGDAGEVVRGDVTDRASIESALIGVDAIVSVLGSKPGSGPHDLLTRGTQNIIDAAIAQGVRRLVVVTGMGAGDSRGHGGFFCDRVLLPLLLKDVYADKDRQEEAVRASHLDWTIVRPGFLTNGVHTGVYRAIGDLAEGTRLRKISRADVADYLLDAASTGRDRLGTVHLTY